MGRSRTIIHVLLAALTCAAAGCDRPTPPPASPANASKPAALLAPGGLGPASNARPPNQPSALPATTTPPTDQVAERTPGFARIRVIAPLGDRVVTTSQPTFIWAGVPPCRRINLIVSEGTVTTFYDLPPNSTSFSVPEDDRLPDGTYTYVVIAESSDREVGSSGEVRFTIRNCPTDINRSGSVTIEDVYAFLNAWLAGRDPGTNQPRAMTVDDVIAYINEWYAGCR